MIALSQMLAAGALAGLVAFGGGYLVGRGDGRDIEVAAQSRADRAAAVVEEKLQARVDTAEAAAATAESARQTSHREIVREVPKIIDRPVYRSVCTDVDGVRLLNRAVSAANGQGGPGAADAAPAPAADAGS